MWSETSSLIIIIFLWLVSPNHTDPLDLALHYETNGRKRRGTRVYPGLLRCQLSCEVLCMCHLTSSLCQNYEADAIILTLHMRKLKLKAIRSYSEWCCQDSTLGLSQTPHCLLHRGLFLVSATKGIEFSFGHMCMTCLVRAGFSLCAMILYDHFSCGPS